MTVLSSCENQAMKTCGGCSREFPLSEFPYRNKDKGYRASRCGDCRRAERRAWYRANVEREKAKARERYQADIEVQRQKMRAHQRLRKYGITQEDYDARLVEQTGACAICGATVAGMRHALVPLVVDHNHETGEVRGLLCAGCNAGLGQFGDNPDRLIAAAAYLLQSKGVVHVGL